MKRTEKIRATLGGDWIPDIYREKVRPQRTRSVPLPVPARENAAEILYTLLGIELKIGRRRIACPDLATARYLQVFARLGCDAVAIPYNITKISPLADELETAWQRMLLLLDVERSEVSPRAARLLRSTLIRDARREIVEIGPGDVMPEFRQSTRQRNS